MKNLNFDTGASMPSIRVRSEPAPGGLRQLQPSEPKKKLNPSPIGESNNAPTSSQVQTELPGTTFPAYGGYGHYAGQQLVSPYLIPGSQQIAALQLVSSMNGADKQLTPLQLAQIQSLQMQSPVPPDVEEEPIYVNAKQYNCIMRRRKQREKLEAKNNIMKRKRYLHESRHKHAVRRQRGAGGRFLPKNASAEDKTKTSTIDKEAKKASN